MGAALKGPWDADAEVAADAAPWDRDEEVGVAPAEAPGKARSFLISSAGPFADEAAALGGAVANKLSGGDFDYAKRRDEYRATQHAAEAAHPTTYHAGEIAAALPQAFVPGGGGLTVGRSLAGALVKGAAAGAFQGFGESEADLTKGDVAGAVKDTGIGALAGAAAGAVGHGLGKVAGWIGDRARAGIRLAEADSGAAENAARQQALRVARSSLGGEAAAAENALKRAEEVVANVSGHYRPDQIANATAWLGGPEAAALRQRAADNLLEAGQNRIPGSLQTAENVFRQAQADAAPEAVEAGAAERLAHPIRDAFLPRLARYASRAVPAAVGGMIGGVPGAVGGALIGAAIGKPGTSISNLMKNPAARKLAWQVVQTGVEGLGKFGPVLQRAATEGGIGLAHMLHETWMESNPEYRAQVGQLLENSQEGR